MLEHIGVASFKELLADTDDKALKMVNEQIACHLVTIDGAERNALASAAKLTREQESFTKAIAAGRVDNASWLTHYAQEVADRMKEVDTAVYQARLAAGIRKAMLDR